MKRAFPLISCLWPFLASAQTEPRINSVLPASVSVVDPKAVDVDGDDDLDLLFLEGLKAPVWIENLGNRSFANPRVIHFPDEGRRLIPADLNGDGVLDFLSFSYEGDVIDGSLADRISAVIVDHDVEGVKVKFPFGASVGIWDAVDLDGDGKAEILNAERVPDSGSEYSLSIWSLQENGDLAAWAPSFSFEGSPYGPATLVDIDGDADLDLRMGRKIFERSGHQSFSGASFSLPLFPEEPDWDEDSEGNSEGRERFEDLDGDGLPDYYYEGYDYLEGEKTVVWRRNLGNFQFSDVEDFQTGEKLLGISSAAGAAAILTVFGKVDIGDGDEEDRLRRIRFGSGEVLLDFPWKVTEPPEVIYSNYDPELVADLDGDGLPDIYLRPTIRLRSSGFNFGNQSAVAWGTDIGFSEAGFITDVPFGEVFQTLRGDFDRDGDLDILAGPDVLGRYRKALNDGEGNFQEGGELSELLPPSLVSINVRVDSIETGDVDGDGDLDLMVNYFQPVILDEREYFTIFVKGNGDGTFQPPVLPPGGFDFIYNSKPCDELFDWDGDGDLDAMRFGAWHENVNGVLSASYTPLLSAANGSDALGNPAELGSFVHGDLDGDGRTDIISTVFDVESGLGPGGLFGFDFTNVAAAVGYGDSYGGIEEVATVPIQLAFTDALGNLAVSDLCVIIDLNKDGANDLLYSEFGASDALGNPLPVIRWKRNPGNGSRNPANWLTRTLSIGPTDGLFSGDFDGNGEMDWSNGRNFITPTLAGPRISPEHDFDGSNVFPESKVRDVADYDGDGDGDILLQSRGQLNLVRNLIIDERSGVAARMRALGVIGKRANPDEDADGDGRCNATEFLDGTDPKVVDRAWPERSQPSLSFAEGGVSVSFENRDDARELDLNYILESSPDLVTWTPVDDEGATMQDLPDPWRVSEIPLGETEDRAFFRVRKTHAVPVK